MGLSTVQTSPFREDAPISSIAEYLKSHRGELSRGDRYYLSMADGLLPNIAGRVEYEPEEAFLEVYVGGGLVTAKPERPRGAGFSGTPGGKGRTVDGFSRQSRTRLIRLIASTEKREKPIFSTMTYPDIYSSSVAVWKRDIDVFGKRFRRAFPDASFVWKIEFKERLTGNSKGLIAPHYHLLVWGVDLYSYRVWAKSAWYDVVGSKSEDHLAAGTQADRVRTWNGVMSYVSKYIAKEQEFPAGWTGRVWGVINREAMPWAARVVLTLGNDTVVRLVRLGRKYLGLGGKTLLFGLTWLMDGDRLLDYVEVLEGL